MLRRKLHWLVAAFCFTVLSFAALAPRASAEDWPTRPVRLILTLGPGSGADIGARMLADKLSKRWGQPVIVDNRPGGDGIVAINAFVSAHDDHILLFTPTSSFTAHPFLHDHLPYKPSDLVPITRVSNTVVAVSVPTSLNVDSLKKLVALAREKPGQLNWAGLTGALDFLLAGWLQQENLNIAKIAYKNPVDAANDLAESRVQLYESAFAIVRPQLQTGKIKLLAVTNSERAPNLPDLPTVAEAGYPALTVDGLVGLFGPTGMSKAARDKITADIRAVADDTIKERLLATGQLLNIGSADEFAKSIEQQRTQVADFAKKLGVQELPQN
ncbi:MAG TPA: tripartite tricarboxylate transporter substrate binding protein [Xanthobacteraceae bacterium]|nr:tripartite tricarboxylate transporter substrate binding protein [Xanthobacteraceae bacterium]